MYSEYRSSSTYKPLISDLYSPTVTSQNYTPCVLLEVPENPDLRRLVRNSPPLHAPKDALPCSNDHITGPYCQPVCTAAPKTYVVCEANHSAKRVSFIAVLSTAVATACPGGWKLSMRQIGCEGGKNPDILGGAVGSDTALQAGRSRVRFSMVSLECFIDIILPAALWPWGRLSL